MSVGDGTQNVFFFAKNLMKQVLFFHFRFKNVEKQQQKDKHPKTDLRHLNHFLCPLFSLKSTLSKN